MVNTLVSIPTLSFLVRIGIFLVLNSVNVYNALLRSRNLVQIVNQRGHEGMVADALELPYRSNTFVS